MEIDLICYSNTYVDKYGNRYRAELEIGKAYRGISQGHLDLDGDMMEFFTLSEFSRGFRFGSCYLMPIDQYREKQINKIYESKETN